MRALVVAIAAAVVASVPAAPDARRVGAAGVSIALPPGWRAIRQAVPPAGTANNRDPVTRIVAASGPVSFGRGCNELDYVFPPRAVALVVVEWVRATPSARWAPRPARFTRATLPVRPPPALECFAGPGGGVQFAERGRRFAAYVLVGRRAPARLVAGARAVLDTLRVKASA
jgi:hypothetical protein